MAHSSTILDRNLSKPKTTVPQASPQRIPDVVEPSSTPQQEKAMDAVLDQNIEDQIRDRAYGLYVQRGREDGNAEQDWLDAELELLALR
jgi:hypothetical protein